MDSITIFETDIQTRNRRLILHHIVSDMRDYTLRCERDEVWCSYGFSAGDCHAAQPG